jgi:hypothetical protein
MHEPVFIKLHMYVCVSLLSLPGEGLVKFIAPFVARQQLGKDIPAARKNCWRRRFLCGPGRIKEK